MLAELRKIGVICVGVTLGLPYVVALLCNLLYGWPHGKNKFTRAMHPRKVFALNYAVLRELYKLQYVNLQFKWKRFYKHQPNPGLCKDLPYGKNRNTLDVYLPRGYSAPVHVPLGQSAPVQGGRAVAVFVYGGTWCSGDKAMYGLLCSNIAERLGVVVCCPNYSTYPQGFVDDMIRDIVDCLQWIHQNIEGFGGDKERIMLIGHSAGAHLVSMATLELTTKGLLENSLQPNRVIQTQASDPDSSYVMVQSVGSLAAGDGPADIGDVPALIENVPAHLENVSTHIGDVPTLIEDVPTDIGDVPIHTETGVIVQDGPEEKRGVARSKSLMDVRNLLSSVKVVVGLAGVYDIHDHYDHESWRGIEDVSFMTRAMVGPQRFDRFSPTVLASSLPLGVRLPAFVLVHGDVDATVPISSSLKFRDSLTALGHEAVQLRVLHECDHLQICLHLMDPEYKWFHTLMNALQHCHTTYLDH